MARIMVGSKIVNFGGDFTRVLFSDADMRSLIGRSFNPNTDCVAVMNADNASANVRLKCAEFYAQKKEISVYADSVVGGSMRVNYLVVAGA